MSVGEMAIRLADKTAVTHSLTNDRGTSLLWASGDIVRALAQRVFDGAAGPDEWIAPRPSTIAEQAAMTVAIAGVVAELGAAVDIAWIDGDVGELVAADAYAIDLSVSGDVDGRLLWIVSPTWLSANPGGNLVDESKRIWLDAAPLVAQVIVARCTLAKSDVAALRVRDVVALGTAASRARLEIAHGFFEGQRDGDHLVVQSGYQRRVMTQPLADDLHVDLAVSAGAVRMSARAVLELHAGQVVRLCRPSDGAVELRIGDTLVGRGELIDLGGELAVRVTSLE